MEGSAQDERLVDLVLADRERIGEELEHCVVAELFGVGLALSSLHARVHDPAVREALADQVAALDRAVRALRRSVFARTEVASAVDWRDRVAEVVHDAGAALGYAPRLEVAGSWDDVPVRPAEELLAVLREALSTVARLTGSTAATVSVAREPADLSLVVTVEVPAPRDPAEAHEATRVAWRTAL